MKKKGHQWKRKERQACFEKTSTKESSQTTGPEAGQGIRVRLLDGTETV